jgi:hypothetical protein
LKQVLTKNPGAVFIKHIISQDSVNMPFFGKRKAVPYAQISDPRCGRSFDVRDFRRPCSCTKPFRILRSRLFGGICGTLSGCRNFHRDR